jgi:hypothetical protein
MEFSTLRERKCFELYFALWYLREASVLEHVLAMAETAYASVRHLVYSAFQRTSQYMTCTTLHPSRCADEAFGTLQTIVSGIKLVYGAFKHNASFFCECSKKTATKALPRYMQQGLIAQVAEHNVQQFPRSSRNP